MWTGSELTARIFASLYVAQLFGFPLASVIPVFAGVDSRPISVSYRIGIVTLTIVVIWRAWNERWSWLKGTFACAGLVLACLLVARMVWDATFVALPLDMPWSDEWTYLLGVAILPILAFVVVPSYDRFDLLRKTGVWVGTITILLVITAAVYSLRNARSFGGRLSTEVLNPISLAQMATSCLIVINARALAGTPKDSQRVLPMLGRWVMTLICILTTIASISKGPILALFTVITVAMLFRGNMDRSGVGIAKRMLVLALSLLVGVGLLLLVDAYTPIQVVSRFVNASSDSSTSTRIDLINGALQQFEESPIIGSSFVEYSSRFYPHNIVVEAMMTNGALGLAALLTMLFGCFYHAGRMLWFFPNQRWIALLFIQYFVVSMFSGSLYFDATTWSTMLLVLSWAQAQAWAAKGLNEATFESGALTSAVQRADS